MNVLLICFAFDALQYRVLRCAAEMASSVHVLGPPGAHRLASSRFCTRFIAAASLGASPDPDRAWHEIDAAASAHDIDLVVPGDGRAVRLMSQLRPLRTQSFPVPGCAAFDRLNDKWRFGELCRALGVRHPPVRLFQDRKMLHQELVRGTLERPIVVKPVDRSGGHGVHIITSEADIQIATRLDYLPILAQTHVDGDDICLSAFCRAGRIEAHVIYQKRRGDCIITSSPELLDLGARILAHESYDGVANFDARLDRSGRIHLLECNPRFWFTMERTLLAGLNFVALAGDAATRNGHTPRMGTLLRSNRSLLRALAMPWTLSALDLAALRFKLRDPIPPLHEFLARLRGRIPEG
jgi:predicted ATP-grasp superfamily ATP-dependent carboligase